MIISRKKFQVEEKRQTMFKSRILGVGMHLPERVVTNHELEAMKELETNDEWIRQRTGIEERHYAVEGETNAGLAFEAAKNAIASAGLTPDEIDFIVYATLSPDYYFPGSGVLLQEKLFGERTVGALDIRTQCSGFVYGLTVASSLVQSGAYKNVLLVGSEIHSPALDFTKRGRGVAVIFGDGAGAVVVGRAPEGHQGILGHTLHSEGKYCQELWLEIPSTSHRPHISPELLEEGRHWPKMNGRMVFKHAVTRMVEAANQVLSDAGKTIDDLDLVLFHQANLRINQMVGNLLKIPEEKIVNTIMWTGNTTAATLPIGMCEALKQGKLKQGDLVLLCAFGAGFTWGASLLYW